MLEQARVLWSRRRRSESDGRFGTFNGVFTPTVLTILGAIMYLRLGQVIGNAGLVGALLIIILAHIITICTGLSVSSIATNTRVGAGGAFAIISRSLGLEVGGAVGVPLYLAQGISVALYVLAFSEGWLRIFPTHNVWLICLIAFAVVFGVAYVSTSFAFPHSVCHSGHCRLFARCRSFWAPFPARATRPRRHARRSGATLSSGISGRPLPFSSRR